MTHLDLFSGIGGFALAADMVWDEVEHVFVENDRFCQEVLKKHWEGEIYGDIGEYQSERKFDLVTGGFPCQPFSAAGVRRGTADERYLWPEMLRVIRLSQPEWVLAENVSGLLTMQGGLVFEQICADLEASGYEVQPFIIPAVAVNAPHRRDRIWFVAHAPGSDDRGRPRKVSGADEQQTQQRPQERATQSSSSNKGSGQYASHQSSERLERYTGQQSTTKERTRRTGQGQPDAPDTGCQRQAQQEKQTAGSEQYSWQANWMEVAAEFCSVDDGLPARLDGFELSKSKHRKEQLKAYGNAIVPQVAVEIMQGMKVTEEEK